MRDRLISIILAVYNDRDHLPRCLDSISRQSYTDFEVILVDDGSTDGSALICDQAAERDARFCAVHLEHKGVYHARNVGLLQAKGAWIGFADADDELLPFALETLYADGKYDLVESDFTVCPMTDSPVLDAEHSSGSYSVVSGKQCVERLFSSSNRENLKQAALWNKLYSRKLLEGLSFDETFRTSADIIFNYRVFIQIERVLVLEAKTYRYYQRPGSISRLASQTVPLLAYNTILQEYIPDGSGPSAALLQKKICRKLLVARFHCPVEEDAVLAGIYADVVDSYRKNPRIRTLEKVMFRFLWRNPGMFHFLMKVRGN